MYYIIVANILKYMEVIMIKLIASDLDGTLFKEHDQSLSEETLELIHEITKKGCHFIAASGRQYDNMFKIFKSIKDDISFISENGALCVDKDEVLRRDTIDPQLCKDIIRAIHEDGRYDVDVSCDKTCYLEAGNPDFIHLVRDEFGNTTTVVENTEDLDEPIMKICIYSNNDKAENFLAFLKSMKEKFGDRIKIVTSGNFWMDFIAPDSNKGNALKFYMEKFGVTPDECVAFGDQYNDVEMLQSVAHSFAMDTCAPGVEKHAKYTTSDVRETLKKILETL